MDQPYSFYSVGKIIQMNSSQPGQLTEYLVWNTLFLRYRAHLAMGAGRQICDERKDWINQVVPSSFAKDTVTLTLSLVKTNTYLKC